MPRPIDAGGIGPAIYASTIAGKVIAEGLEAGDNSEQGLWKFNTEYVKTYGYRMASFEILRRFLQILTNEDLNYGMKHFLGQDDVDSITRREHPEFKRVSLGNPVRMIWALPRLALARGLRYTAQKSMRLIQQYMNYPNSPHGFEEWHAKFIAELHEAYDKFS
jgi:flavin-dependent dehydrogenase